MFEVKSRCMLEPNLPSRIPYESWNAVRPKVSLRSSRWWTEVTDYPEQDQQHTRCAEGWTDRLQCFSSPNEGIQPRDQFARADITIPPYRLPSATGSGGTRRLPRGGVVIGTWLELRKIGCVAFAKRKGKDTQSDGDVYGRLELTNSSEMNPWTLLDNGALVLSDRANKVHWGTCSMAELGGSSPSNPWLLDKHGALVLQGMIALLFRVALLTYEGNNAGKTGDRTQHVEAGSVHMNGLPSRGSTSQPAETSPRHPAPPSRILDAQSDFDMQVASGRLKYNTRICAMHVQSSTRTLRPRPSPNNDENQAPRAPPRGLRRVTTSTSSAATRLVIRTAAEKARQSYDLKNTMVQDDAVVRISFSLLSRDSADPRRKQPKGSGTKNQISASQRESTCAGVPRAGGGPRPDTASSRSVRGSLRRVGRTWVITRDVG
ncbi:hypothetical protein K438DRAFT_1755021 [Mycena galopus ATCC 62051]|nr:hypothetical protein K438DRAFT_1755021 [Mycena galopus ATCC 62051]